MSGVRPTNTPKPQPAPRPSEPKKKPEPRPDENGDGLFRDEQSDDGWHKTDSPGSGGGYGVRTSKDRDNVMRPKTEREPATGDLFTDRVDIKFPDKKK